MSKLIATLKDLVSRVARKEIKAQTATVRRAAIQHRRDIARLKEQTLALGKKLGSVTPIAEKSHSYSKPAVLEGVRFGVRSVKAQRRRLKFSAQEFGDLLGVTAQTVYNWEQGKVRPR